jgi:hypothetical protein
MTLMAAYIFVISFIPLGIVQLTNEYTRLTEECTSFCVGALILSRAPNSDSSYFEST